MSYILTTKDSADALEKTLVMCRELLKPNDELIVVDCDSRDRTKEVVGENNDIISIFISEPDFDGDHAANKGILHARGKYIKMIGHENIHHPEATEKVIRVMEEHPDIDVLVCGGISKGYGREHAIYVPPGANFGKSPEDVFRYYPVGCGVGHFFRRSVFARAGLLPRTYCTDSHYLMKTIASGATVKFCRINAFYYPFKYVDAYLPDYGKTSRDVKEEYWLGLAKEYCSPSFYRRYYIERKLQKIRKMKKSISKPLRSYLWSVFGKAPVSAESRAQVNEENISGMSKQKYVWDGGFS